MLQRFPLADENHVMSLTFRISSPHIATGLKQSLLSMNIHDGTSAMQLFTGL